MGKMKSYYWDKIQGDREDYYDFTQYIFERLEKMPVETLKVLSKQENTAPYAKIILKEKGVQE